MALGAVASFRTYVFLSIVLSTVVVGHAAYQKRFFYRTMVYLSDSKIAILAVGNLCLVSVILVWKMVQNVFLGRLRFREIERLNFRARDAIIECCFATTIFREEVNLTFLALVTTLLMLKSLHWLAKDRTDFLEEQPMSPRIAHLRLVGLMTLLFAADTYLVTECAKTTYRTKGGTMLVLFAFEFTVLLIELMSDFVRYVFHVVDLHTDGRWESKGLYVFYNELVTDLCQLTVYLAFFLYVHTFYTFPLHIMREVYLTFAKFYRRCSDFIRYRRVVSTMNDLFADATEEELASGDRTCIICREEMPEAKKLACGHMFHARCLQSWLRRQLSCPTCRSDVDVNPPTRPLSAPAGAPADAPPPGARPAGAARRAPEPPANPGFFAQANLLWRHIAYGAPRDGAAAPAPANMDANGNPNPRVPAGAPRARHWPQFRFGVRVQAGRGAAPQHLQRQALRQHRNYGQAQRAVQAHQPQQLHHAPQYPYQDLGFMAPPQVVQYHQPIFYAPVQPPAAAQPPRQGVPPQQPDLPQQAPPPVQAWTGVQQDAERVERLRRGQPMAVFTERYNPPLEQLITMQEHVEVLGQQVDILREQMRNILLTAADAAVANTEAPPTHVVEPAPVTPTSPSPIPVGAERNTSEPVQVPERIQSEAPVDPRPDTPDAENSEQAALRERRLRFLNGKSEGSNASGSAN